MAWQPNLRDVEQREPAGNLLSRSLDLLSIPLRDREDKLEDKHGVFGYNLPKFVLVAKKYIWGNIVSCHMRAIASAMNQKKPLVMYIAKSGKFYQFDAKDVFGVGKENIKGGQKMMNFNITLGNPFSLSYDTSKRCPLCRSALRKISDMIGSQKVDYACENQWGTVHYFSEDYLKNMGR